MPKYLIALIFALMLPGAVLCGQSPLSEAETGQITEMLRVAELDSLSLCFEKDWDLSTKYKLDWQLSQLQDPWLALRQLQELREACAAPDSLLGSSSALLRHLGAIAFVQPDLYGETYVLSHDLYQGEFNAKVRKPEDLFSWLESSLNQINEELKGCFSTLRPGDAERLSSWWLWQFIEAEDTLRYKAYYRQTGLPDYDSLDLPQLRDSFAAIEYQRLLAPALKLQALGDVLAENAPRLKFSGKKLLSKKTSLGLMVIGTTGDDFYDRKTLSNRNICFLLDPGGDDRYELDLQTDRKNTLYLLLDLKGNDIYRNSSPGAMFCSRFGLGYSLDLGGDDLYQTDDFGFSAFLGINQHQDLAGDDVYRSGLFSQGAAMFGLSLLLDHKGNDSYSAPTCAQGFGSTRGCGALLDLEGADNYLLGGKYYHAPLMPLDYRTMGQGMGFGLRPELAGGLGLLYDRKGNDRYLGGVYAQGVGYWYASGALIDEAGNDVYNAVYYPQGSGIHLANGLLYDGSGDDAYYSRNGPGQGSAHDWGLGIMIDAAGNDAYSIHGGNGMGLSNSVAIFVDKSGDDRYERNEGQNYGSGAFARSTGSIGLFLDAGGKDSYPDSLKHDDTTWQKGTYGIGRDLSLNVVEKTTVEELAEAAAMPDSTDTIENIFAIASEWEVGSAVQRVRRAREILLSRESEAVDYVLANKMNSKSGLEYRALEALAKKSPAFIQRLYPVIMDSDSLAAKNAIFLISGVGDSLLVDALAELLSIKRYEVSCLSALGGIDRPRSVELLKDYIFHSSERFRYITARSLLQIKHPSAREALELMQGDDSFLVQALLRNLPPEEAP